MQTQRCVSPPLPPSHTPTSAPASAFAAGIMADEKVSLEAGSPLLPELPDWSEEELEQEFDTRITTIAAELEADAKDRRVLRVVLLWRRVHSCGVAQLVLSAVAVVCGGSWIAAGLSRIFAGPIFRRPSCWPAPPNTNTS